MIRFLAKLEDFYYRVLIKKILKLSKLGHGFIVEGAESGFNYEHIYNNKAQGRYGVGKLIDRLFLDLKAVRSTRLRKDVLKNFIWNEIENQKVLKKKTNILDLASGGARYLRELRAEHNEGLAQSICIDRNAVCVNMGRSLLKSEGVENIRFVRGDVFKARHFRRLSAALKWRPDIVVASGFFIYLNDLAVHELIKEIYGLLKPGGLFVFQSYENLDTKKLMRKTMATATGEDWTLYYRKPDYWRELLYKTGFKDVVITRDQWLMNNVCLGRKQNA